MTFSRNGGKSRVNTNGASQSNEKKYPVAVLLVQSPDMEKAEPLAYLFSAKTKNGALYFNGSPQDKERFGDDWYMIVPTFNKDLNRREIKLKVKPEGEEEIKEICEELSTVMFDDGNLVLSYVDEDKVRYTYRKLYPKNEEGGEGKPAFKNEGGQPPPKKKYAGAFRK